MTSDDKCKHNLAVYLFGMGHKEYGTCSDPHCKAQVALSGYDPLANVARGDGRQAYTRKDQRDPFIYQK